MSLLLEALKRAEDDSKKRKQAAAEARVSAPPPAFVHSSMRLSFSDSGDSGLALLDDRPAKAQAISPESAEAATLSSVDFVDIDLDSPEASPSAAMPIEPAFRAAAPRSVTSAMPPTTPRQAKSAANVMSGMPKAKSRPAAPQKRTALLAIAALLIALPVAAFLLFGDKLLGNSGTLQATVPQQSPPLASATQTTPATPVMSTETPKPAGTSALPQPAAVSASVTLAAPTPTTTPAQALPARKSAVATQQASADNPPTPRARTSTPPRAMQGDGATRSTVIDLDRPAATNRAASPQPQATRKPPTAMESAYAAYQSGNSQEASRLYREVLKQDPTQRDAWLGLAVIAHNNNQLEAALDAYKRVLRLEPQNPTALAGLTALNNNADEPRQESKLRELLARSPQEADLNHSLALVLSAERRWSEAQQLFFKAHTLAPQEPQFAYNLAVTLDQLRRPALAAQYYETALRLAQGKAASFDEARARTRLAALRAGGTGGTTTSAGSETKTP